MRLFLFVLIVGITACERREVPPAELEGAAAMADSMSLDSAARDSAARDSAANPPIIGHDSAFGPIMTIDTTGRMVELPRRRP